MSGLLAKKSPFCRRCFKKNGELFPFCFYIKERRRIEARPEEKVVPFDLAGFRVQFAFDDCNLSSEARENLEKIVSWMSKKPAAKIQIQGNTCKSALNTIWPLARTGRFLERLASSVFGSNSMEKPMLRVESLEELTFEVPIPETKG